MNPRFGIPLFFLLSISLLSVGQAWVVRSGPPRVLRYVLVWGAAVFLMTTIASMILELGTAPPARRADARLVLVWIAAAIAAIALLAGARWGAKRAASAGDLVSAATGLAGIHALVVIVGGAIGLLIAAVAILAQIRW